MKFGWRAAGLIATLTALRGAGAAHAQPAWPPPYREPVLRAVKTSAPRDLPWTTPEAVMRSENLKNARMNGKYRMLMLQFDEPKSAEKYGALRDIGFSTGPSGVFWPHGLPQIELSGYWVYAAPSWYVWRELAQYKIADRAGAEVQAVGPPNTNFTGSVSKTAWRAKWPDEPNDWILLEFEHSLQPCRLQIYQSLHPGAIKRITMMAKDGREVEVWAGLDPTRTVQKSAALFELVLDYPPFYSFMRPDPAPRATFSTNRVKLYLDSAVAGWNEIDAVALMDFSNIPQWACAALASSRPPGRNPPERGLYELPLALIGGWTPMQPPDVGAIDLSLFDFSASLLVE